MPSIEINGDIITEDLAQTGCPVMYWSDWFSRWVILGDPDGCPHDPKCWVSDQDRIENITVHEVD